MFATRATVVGDQQLSHHHQHHHHHSEGRQLGSSSGGGGGGGPGRGGRAAQGGRRTENVDTMFDNLEELVGSTPSEKNWKAIGIALVVIASILSVIGVSIIIVTPELFVHHETSFGEPVTFTESMDWPAHLRRLGYQWLRCGGKDLLLYLNDTDGNLYQLQPDRLSGGNGSTWPAELFLRKEEFSEGRIDSFEASPDCQTLLLPTKVEKRYRHSILAQYRVVRVGQSPAQKPTEAVLCPERSCYSASNPVKLQLAVWGPTGSFIAFVHQNNVYYAENPFNMAPVRITDNGGDAVANGIASWLYEEEILETITALWVSPGNQRIAYLRFNDSRTGRYDMPWFGSPEAAYPQSRTVFYPKAGDVGSPISNVTVHVFDVKTTLTVGLVRPASVPEEHYISAVRWLDSDLLLLAWLDRSQTEGCLTVCRLPQASCWLIYNEHQPAGWVELMKQTSSQPLVDLVGNRIFTVLHNSGFRRIAYLKTDTFKVLQWITPATYDVSDIVHFDSVRRHLYFLSCREHTDSCDATKMHVHRIAVPSSDLQSSVANCLTCDPLLRPLNISCEYNAASFSPSGEHFLHECLGPEPFQYFLRLNDYSSGYRVQVTLERNDYLKQCLSSRRVPRTVFKRLLLRNRTTGKDRADPLEVNAKLLLPAQLNESHFTQYPLLLKVYGGPTAQLVTRRFELGWQHYLGSALHFITASVDGRGTGNRGSDFLFAIKSSFAGVELQDQMDALKALRSLQYVNNSAVAVFGWSYGGFLALHMLGHPFNANNSYCSCAVAVASVTDFSYYNSGYTERYLGIKSDKSAEAYRRTNVTQLAGNFWNKDLFLVHGTGDENVHYQNTAQLVKALVQESIDFEFMTYPDDSHGLVNSQTHVFQRITTFLVDTFNKTSERRRLLRGRTHGVCEASAGTC